MLGSLARRFVDTKLITIFLQFQMFCAEIFKKVLCASTALIQ